MLDVAIDDSFPASTTGEDHDGENGKPKKAGLDRRRRGETTSTPCRSSSRTVRRSSSITAWW